MHEDILTSTEHLQEPQMAERKIRADSTREGEVSDRLGGYNS
jgi:hypothetical protein